MGKAQKRSSARESGSRDQKLAGPFGRHSIAKDLKCEEVPVMAILKKFRDCAGIRGRRKHTGTNPPTYNYCVMPEASTALTVAK